MGLSEIIAAVGVGVAIWAVYVARSANTKADKANRYAEREFGRKTEVVSLHLNAKTTGVSVPHMNGVIEIVNEGTSSAHGLSAELFSPHHNRRESYPVSEELGSAEALHLVVPDTFFRGEPILWVDVALIYRSPAGNPRRQEYAELLLAPGEARESHTRGPWHRDEIPQQY